MCVWTRFSRCVFHLPNLGCYDIIGFRNPNICYCLSPFPFMTNRWLFLCTIGYFYITTGMFKFQVVL